jgi:hypothetical protein
MEMDVEFAIDVMIHLGPDAGHFRNRMWTIVRQVAAALHPLDEYARSHRLVHHVAGKAPAFAAFLVAVFGWRDASLPWDLVQGFPLIGDVPPSHVLREKPVEATVPLEDFVGNASIAYVDHLEAHLTPRERGHKILELTEAEIELGPCPR